MPLNIEYITMQFPIYKWLGFSAGLIPYSFSGYNFYSSDYQLMPTTSTVPDTIKYTKTFIGSGGISQMYGGLSANIFNHVSLDLNAYYMFGNVYNSRSSSFSETVGSTTTTTGFDPTTQTDYITVSNFRLRLGAQFYNTFAEKHDVTLGLIYEQKAKFNGSYTSIRSDVLTDTLDVPGSEEFDLPTMYGLGFYYTYDKKLSIGADYSLQKWSEARFIGSTGVLNDRSKIAVGVEYQPNYRGRKFSDRMKYRAGFNISDAYYKVDGVVPPKNFGISFGLGLPLYNKATNSTSMLNTTVEYGKIGSTSLLREDYIKFTLNVAFNEHWFFKRKL